MLLRTKKLENGKLNRISGSGEIKEITIKEDLFEPEKAKIELCFMGEKFSGIIELTKEEVENISNEFTKKLKKAPSAKVMKFRK
ncbi:hypothetical protein J4474_02250 [Candidatus Pacearchaeota archaeon]|nr:hypothetical protein [Candidatus Pacearchaeota archaeon]